MGHDRGAVAAVALLLVLATSVLLGVTGPSAPARAAPAVEVSTERVPVDPEPDGQPVALDVAIYTPAQVDDAGHPAVLLAHGFGGSRTDLDEQARELADDGLVVITWTARGFGDSGGRIHLNDPDFEVADARALVDLVAARPEVALDGPGDPHLAVTGGSYGGALALMLAATEPRVDAVASLYTWHDLATALFPNRAEESELPGPFRQQWISRFFLSTVAQGAEAEPPAPPPCGRFDPTVCHLLLDAAESGRPSDRLLELLHRHSPADQLPELTAPTLLVQGMRDTLFGLEQADATAGTLLANGTDTTVRWSDGGHDGAASGADVDSNADTELVRHWLRDRLGAAPDGSDDSVPETPLPAFSWAGPQTFGSEGPAPSYSSDRYPGRDPRTVAVPLQPSPGGTILTPPGGQPASITSAPGSGGVDQQFSSYPLAALPGQSIAFDTAPISSAIAVVGAPTVHLRVTSTGSAVTLFVTLWQVNDTSAAQPRQLVAPVRLRVQPNQPSEVAVQLPMATWQFDKGTTWRVLVTSTDAAYSNPTAARADRVELASPTLEVPTVAATPAAATSPLGTEAIGLMMALGAVGAVIAGWAVHRRRADRRAAAEPAPSGAASPASSTPASTTPAAVPLLVDNLTKSYPDGHRAVSEVSWRADRGQVVGLLGPNGAGKTTTLRMVLGLIRPDSGRVLVGGTPVRPGASVLSDIGALVEGPGFLPHLTGRQNLRAHWAATGRPDPEAAFEESLQVAALGEAIDRPVRSYSHGMRQRLGIAQAMLGRPDVLILDEPTNGLDPPQIAAMRPILRAYADSGRTVVISSHLLAEVEQTCTHVVVMDGGRVISSGAVEELLDGQQHLEELFLDLIADSGVHDGPGQSVADRLRQVRPR